MTQRLIDLMKQANDPQVGQGILRMARLAVTAHFFEQSYRENQAEPLLRLVGTDHDSQPAKTFPIHKYQKDDQASELRRMVEEEQS